MGGNLEEIVLLEYIIHQLKKQVWFLELLAET